MLHFSLLEIARREGRVQEEIAPDHPIWEGTGAAPLAPLEVDLTARPVGSGVLVSGALRGSFEIQCRRCLSPVRWELDEEISLWFEPLEEEEWMQLEGEVYALPQRGTELDLMEPVREQLLLRLPGYLVCRADCAGLCARCGAELNEAPCSCEDEPAVGAWDALKKLKFD